LISCAVLLCALPADGDTTVALAPAAIDVLTSIDAMPTQAALYDAFGAPPLLPDNPLLTIARDPTADLGVVLRAIRTLPLYCPPVPGACGNTTVHDELVALVESFRTSQGTPLDLLRLRAAVEALGATHSGLATDVTELLSLFGNASRDMRVTVVRALRNLCNSTAIEPLRQFLSNEQVRQVQLAISAAVQDLSRCTN
jgi:hypothetical protein